jgi:hypothetical protein
VGLADADGRALFRPLLQACRNNYRDRSCSSRECRDSRGVSADAVVDGRIGQIRDVTITPTTAATVSELTSL